MRQEMIGFWDGRSISKQYAPRSRLVLGTGTRLTVSIPVTQVPGRYPGITQYPCYFFTKLGTLFLSDNLNTTARAVDALHLHHKAGLQGWVPFIAPALLSVPAMSKRSVGFHLKSRCGDARRRACRTPNAAINQIRS